VFLVAQAGRSDQSQLDNQMGMLGRKHDAAQEPQLV
jgi:hypothetical protein